LAVALDLACAVLCLRRRRARRQSGEGREPHATAASVLFDSPWLSSQLTSILSPLAPPFRRNENTGLRDTAWLIWASTTVLPLTLTRRFWMKCIGTSLPSESLRWPVSIGWFISTRTSVKPCPSVARIFIGPVAMECPFYPPQPPIVTLISLEALKYLPPASAITRTSEV